MKLVRILILVSSLLLVDNATAQQQISYQRLLMQDEVPSEVIGYPYVDGFIQFQRFNKNVARDTIVILNVNQNDITMDGGICLEEYDYFENMQIILFDKRPFFFVKLRNYGNSNGNKIKAYFINEKDGTIHPADFVKADSIHSLILDNDFFIWDEQKVTYSDELIISEFSIWRQGDLHSNPSGGEMTVVYGIERIDESKYKFVPKKFIKNKLPAATSLVGIEL